MRALLPLLTALFFLAAPALAADFDATVEWDYDLALYSQPDGFNVYVSRNGSGMTLEQTVVEPTCVVTASSGDVLQIEVAAKLGDDEGEASVPSEPFTFIRLGIPTNVRVLLQVN